MRRTLPYLVAVVVVLSAAGVQAQSELSPLPTMPAIHDKAAAATSAIQGQARTTSGSPLPHILNTLMCTGTLSVSGPVKQADGKKLLTITAASTTGDCRSWHVHVDYAFCDQSGGADPGTFTCDVSCLSPGTYNVHLFAGCGTVLWPGQCDWAPRPKRQLRSG